MGGKVATNSPEKAVFVFLFTPLNPSCSAMQDEDFEEMLSAAQAMETQYSHLFDKVLVNGDLSTAFAELRLALRKVEVEAQWVPISWTHS